MDGNTIAFLGELLSYSGDLDQGLKFAERAKQLNPNHPGWYWITDYYDAYRQSDYRKALSCALKINIPGHWGTQAMLCAAYAQLGELEQARKALRALESSKPGFQESIRNDLEQWFEPEYVQHLLDGMRKTGVKI